MSISVAIKHRPKSVDLTAAAFENTFVRDLPSDPVTVNVPRQVANACFTRVDPTPVAAPRLLAWSEPLAHSLGLARPGPEAVEALAGNRVQPVDVLRQLGGEHQRLSEAAHAARRRIAAQVAQPQLANGRIGRAAPAFQPGANDAQRLAMQILGQVTHARANLVVHRMAPPIGRPAQRHDEDVEAAALERGDLLGDEGFRQPRIALQDDCNAQANGCG